MSGLNEIVSAEILLILLHMVLIVSVVIIAAYLIAVMLCRRHAAARQSIWLAALILVAVTPVAISLTRQAGWRFVSVPVDVANWGVVEAVAEHADRRSTLPMAPPQQESPLGQMESPVLASEESGTYVTESMIEPEVAPGSSAAHGNNGVASAVALSGSTLSADRISPAKACAALVLVIWALGILYFTARLIIGLLATKRLVEQASPFDAPSATQIHSVMDALGVSKLPPVATSPHLSCPVVVGIVQPRVLFLQDMRYRRGNAVYYVITQIGTPKAEQLLRRLSAEIEDEPGKRRAVRDLAEL